MAPVSAKRLLRPRRTTSGKNDAASPYFRGRKAKTKPVDDASDAPDASADSDPDDRTAGTSRNTSFRNSKTVAEKKIRSIAPKTKAVKADEGKTTAPARNGKTNDKPARPQLRKLAAGKDSDVSSVAAKSSGASRKLPERRASVSVNVRRGLGNSVVASERLSDSEDDGKPTSKFTHALKSDTKDMDVDSGFHGQSNVSVSGSALSENSLNESGVSDVSSRGRFPRRNVRRAVYEKEKLDDEESVDDSDADPHFKASSDEDTDVSDVEQPELSDSDDASASNKKSGKKKLKFIPSGKSRKSSLPFAKQPMNRHRKKAISSFGVKKSKKDIKASLDDNFIDDSDSDGWEAVEELGSNDEGPSTSNPVAVTISVPTGTKKKEVDMEKFLLNRLKRRQREMRVDIHKVHLVCSLGHGFFLNDVIGRDPQLLGIALSLWETSVIQNKSLLKTLDPLRVKTLVGSIKSHFPVVPESCGSAPNTVRAVRRTLLSKQCPSYLHLTMAMLLMLRSLGLEVRLIYNLQPFSVKEAKLSKPSAKKEKPKTSPYFQKIKEGLSGKKGGKKTAEKKKRALSSDEDSEYEDKQPKKKPRAAIATKPTSADSCKKDAKSPVSKGEPEEQPTTSQNTTPKKSKTGTVPKRGAGVDYWLDVYCPKSKAYVPVHCILGDVNRFEECERDASQPIQYVVAFGEENSAKDVTAVFCQNWLTINRKLQVDVAWWKETLDLYKPKNRKRDEEEEEKVRERLLARPRPKTVQEYKGHPLYIVPRHLLKYEAIYPPNPNPVDHVRGEPVFLRDVVHLLHTRENWLKEARLIKLGEKPYKEVKKIVRRKKRKRHGHDPTADLLDAIDEKEKPKDQMAPLYGRWQTMDYINPVAKNGRVPRNEYGNVDMFQPSMLPIGCVQIPIKNIHRIAKQLNIDCAAAMTGWDFSGGHCHPVMDGWIVCEEYYDTLMDAWNNEQDKIMAEEKTKKSQKAIDNWKKLMRGLQWKKKLQFKYGIDPDKVDSKTVKQLQIIQVDSDDD